MNSGTAHPRANKATEAIVHEARRFLWMFLYLWALLGLFVLN